MVRRGFGDAVGDRARGADVRDDDAADGADDEDAGGVVGRAGGGEVVR